MGKADLRPGEYGFLLLTSQLGNPRRKPLTVAQFRELMARSDRMDCRDASRDVTAADFMSLGYTARFAGHIAQLLQEEQLLEWYLAQARKAECVPVTRVTEGYPLILRKRLGQDSPGVIWAKGDLTLLERPAIALVGSRDLQPQNRDFAREVGRQAALQGLTLVSGNARGADKTAQNACLQAGGSVISVVADALTEHTPRENILYLSESSFDEGFSAQRALSRNRCIHALGRMVFVAQSDLHKGGTWDGTVKNLRSGWSPVACFRDGSAAASELEQLGAYLVGLEDLRDFCALQRTEACFF